MAGLENEDIVTTRQAIGVRKWPAVDVACPKTPRPIELADDPKTPNVAPLAAVDSAASAWPVPFCVAKMQFDADVQVNVAGLVSVITAGGVVPPVDAITIAFGALNPTLESDIAPSRTL